MNREEFRRMAGARTVILDGATGTNLQSAGMPVGVCPETWILEHKDVIVGLQEAYVDAGVDILYAPTFTGNRLKLADFGMEERLEEINAGLVEITRAAAQDKALVAADMTMTGRQLWPVGSLRFEELVDIYRDQAYVLSKSGVDLFVVETMMSLQETRAAVLAIREITDLPIMATLTFEKDGRTLYGTTPEAAVVTLQSLGCDAVGINCSTGPEQMAELIQRMVPYAKVPLIAKPNAGVPVLKDGKTLYKESPEQFAEAAAGLVEAGASIVGGCCGTTPEHMKLLVERIRADEEKRREEGKQRTENVRSGKSGADEVPEERKKASAKMRVLSSERAICEINPDGPMLIIGERINPTGKTDLQAELREGKMDLVCRYAQDQAKEGARILDVNMGLGGIDEEKMMVRAIEEITQVTDLPLCIDSSSPEVLRAALRIYPGRALVNSITWEKEKFDMLVPVIQKYGAMCIFLPISDEGIPKTQEEKHAIIREALEKLEKRGIDRTDVIVDGLTATIGADPEAAMHFAETCALCKNELDVATISGLSNISFGLPERSFVNAAFMVMAANAGLTMAIANPSQDSMMMAARAVDMLRAKAGSDLIYIEKAQQYAEKMEKERKAKTKRTAVKKTAESAAASGAEQTAAVSSEGAAEEPVKKKKPRAKKKTAAGSPLYEAVLRGEKGHIAELCEEELAGGAEPEAIINGTLIPAINEVGDLFNRQQYFLPQLIRSAKAMETAVAYLEPRIPKKEESGEASTVLIATVEGDVHDIGKNLVAMMLKNYGFRVVDLGKDVPAEEIIAAAIREKAEVVALSALMTTTMVKMKEVIDLAGKMGYDGKVIVGGAAVTKEYAAEIGADGYSVDAADCVRVVRELLK